MGGGGHEDNASECEMNWNSVEFETRSFPLSGWMMCSNFLWILISKWWLILRFWAMSPHFCSSHANYGRIKNDINFGWPWVETDTFLFVFQSNKIHWFLHIKKIIYFKLLPAKRVEFGEQLSNCMCVMCIRLYVNVCVYVKENERKCRNTQFQWIIQYILSPFISTSRAIQKHWHFIRIVFFFCCCCSFHSSHLFVSIIFSCLFL